MKIWGRTPLYIYYVYYVHTPVGTDSKTLAFFFFFFFLTKRYVRKDYINIYPKVFNVDVWKKKKKKINPSLKFLNVI